MSGKKHIALKGKLLSLRNKIIIGKGVAPRLLNERLTNLMGGLIISENPQNILRGGKLNNIVPKKPIRFLV